jgi:hypothetical protein
LNVSELGPSCEAVLGSGFHNRVENDGGEVMSKLNRYPLLTSSNPNPYIIVNHTVKDPLFTFPATSFPFSTSTFEDYTRPPFPSVLTNMSTTDSPKMPHLPSSQAFQKHSSLVDAIVQQVSHTGKPTELVYKGVGQEDGRQICHLLASSPLVERRGPRYSASLRK